LDATSKTSGDAVSGLHGKILKALIREHAEAAAFHLKASEKLKKELAFWKKENAKIAKDSASSWGDQLTKIVGVTAKGQFS